MTTKLLRVALALAALVCGAIGLSPVLLYWYGLSRIPDERFETDAPPVPATSVALVWASLGGTGEPIIEPETPYGFVWQIYTSSNDGALAQMTPAQQLANLAARGILPRGTRLGGGMATWHLARVSALIWATQNWSPTQATTAYLNEASFGHGIVGPREAAMAYFGREIEELDRTQLAILIATIVSRPADVLGISHPDPWCNPDVILASAQSLTPEAKISTETVRSLPAPAGACMSRG